MAKKSFIQGAAILGMAGILVKVLGACFRIPLGNMIGDVGMAYYQAVYPVYNLFLAISTAGIPIAISKMVSERNAIGRYNEGYRVFKISFGLMFAIGIVSAIICYAGAEFYFEWCGIPEAKYAMRALAPAICFVPLMASFRGYFQGNQNMSPTAISQLIEQFFRVVVGLVLAGMLMTRGLEFAAAGASFGATAGSIGGVCTVAIIYILTKNKYRDNIEKSAGTTYQSSASILKDIVYFAVPITLGAAIMPIMNAIDVPIVMDRLAYAGFSETESKALYGQLSGFTGSLINFPQVLTQAVAVSIVPVISEMNKLGKIKELQENAQMGLRMSMLMGIPCAVGMMVLAEPIMLLFYPMQKASARGAAECLVIMAIGVIFFSGMLTLTGILQGAGKQMVPVKNMCVGVVFKIVLTYVLCGIPEINVKGAAIATLVTYIVVFWIDVYTVKKYTGTRFNYGVIYGKPGIAAVVMGIVVWAGHKVLTGIIGNSLATVAAVGLGVAVYGIMILKTKAINRDELRTFPKGNTLVKIVDKLRLW
ncbi:MAG: polysaccharide biosynthesis protein [Firmicutes bacterium]|nr:polysaccharide biosynthesis protein [Bacillota bacterium]